MIITVTTAKDNLSNIQRFVEGNAASGVDHMVIFLDAPDPEVSAWLAARPDVTAVQADRSWWQGRRPELLNRRQNINANAVKAALAVTGLADWVFHIDIDEIAQIDRAVLDGVAATERAVRLAPAEVISRSDSTAEPTWFKPLLSEGDLHLLFTLGLLEKPTNVLYFRSHIGGKVGVRPALDIWAGIHRAQDLDSDRIPLVQDPGLAMLHYESYSGEEFVRKWQNMVTSGPSINFGPHRMKIATGLKALLAKDLPENVRARYLREIYERHMQDPFEDLRDLGMLIEVDPRQGGQSPRLFTDHERQRLRAALDHVAAVPSKAMFVRREAEAMREVARTLAPITTIEPVWQPRPRLSGVRRAARNAKERLGR